MMKATILQRNLSIFLFFVVCHSIHSSSVFAQGVNHDSYSKSYPVGLQTILGKEGDHRTVMQLWYPSFKNERPSYFSIQSYLQSFRNVIQLNHAPDSVRKTIEGLLESYGVDAEKNQFAMQQLDRLRDTIYLNGKPLDQVFPLVIINSALQNEAIFHTHMAHFLASKGYVVVALGSGVGPGIPVLQYDTTAVKWQIEDIEVAIKTVGRVMKNAVNTEKTALISWSTGGIAAWRFAEKTGNTKVLISLDAAMGYAYGLDIYRQLPKRSLSLAPTVRVLHFKAKKGSVQQDVSILQSLGKDQIELIDVPELNHYHFTSLANLMNQSFTNNIVYANAYQIMLQKITTFLFTHL